jgi:DNA-directed RNA polymerase subunit RPC12/RpoP
MAILRFVPVDGYVCKECGYPVLPQSQWLPTEDSRIVCFYCQSNNDNRSGVQLLLFPLERFK